MAKFKFKGNTTADVEKELEGLCESNINEIPLNHIVRVVKVIGVELSDDKASGSQVRFQHPDAGTFGHYFGVHKVHKGGDKDVILKRNFIHYMMPVLRRIISIRKQKGI